ncbi:beta-ketoacyl-[acyl-carrier-protein] synthase family protein [Nocardia sp. NPDC127579]|uniref:beta-ketoacyl-[acyl-carrier-protein] synthase family protein n=1 Tax=Nocardia sp. NPDC127579 TaxID=3345402 RepID=UPI00363C6F0B
MTRVFITGLGAVSHAARTVPELVSRLYDPKAPEVVAPDLGDMNIPTKRFALMADEDRPAAPETVAGFATSESMRAILVAAREALADAGHEDDDSLRIGVVLGSSNGDAALVEQYRTRGEQLSEQGWVPMFAAAPAVASELGTTGPALSLSNACAGSGYAIAIGAQLIESGEADVVIAGGYETFSRVALAVFNQVGAVSQGTCLPFSRDRDGTTLGEAAAAVVLERADLAAGRDCRIYGEIAGQGWSCDAFHVTGLDPEGGQLIRAMRTSMAEAGVTPGDLSMVVPHGTGTRNNDSVEAAATAVALAPHAARIPFYSSKALLGHTAGASGTLSVIAAVTFLGRGVMPPNLLIDEVDPEVGLMLPMRETPLAGDTAMVNTYGFGGNNMSLIVKKVDRESL